MAVEHLLFGFLVKIITGFDDTLTNVPVLASVTKVRMGKIAFSVGTLLAIAAAIIASMLLTQAIGFFRYSRYIAAALIFLLAALIYFDVFVHKPRTKAEKKLMHRQKISAEHFTKLIGIGFFATIVTALDDIIAYTPLFLGAGFRVAAFAIAGILAATIVEIILVVYFAGMIAKIKHKQQIASAGLVILGILTLSGII
jgi:hypothetical protein